MAKTKTQKKNYQSWREGRRKLEDNNLFSKYSNKFKRKKQVDGKWVDWDVRTDAPWNPEAAWNTIYQNVYGTGTPGIDNKYLNAKEAFDNEQGRIKGNDALSNLRRQFSPKTVNEGERQIDIKRNETTLQKESELRALRQDSSFRIDHESIPNWEGGEFEATDEVESLTDQADSKSQGNPWMPQASYNVAMQGGNTVFIGNDTDRVNAAEFQKVAYAADQRTKLSETGGQEYVTDYQTAIQNSRRDGLSFGDAKQYYGEDVLDSAGQRVRKSNVFTEDADGNPMGVKTRKQRLAEDLARAEAAIPKPDKTEDKKEVKTNKDDLTTTKTGTVSNDAGTPKGVVEKVIKAPLSDLFDDRIG